ncbi:MFS transporter [Anaeromyxobacter terrae]|uniref:MFS transporter n=1 Tax=Anaeromyxobacter terrae TaxID=2925406 RepID=UPI001F58E6F6|nr:MFS transporter [Anaeromyxobacter sp. SG22]
MRQGLTERRLLLVIGAIQFVNVLDFMMVMPLGPDFARALGIPNAKLGLVGASYTAAAALTGIVGALVLDRFDRRKALGVVLAGLVVGTAAGAFATSLESMLAARLLAGAFGGPATSLSLAVVSDVVPPERRGRAMGAVMGAFALASVLGVPAGLELARIGGWRLPFFAVAALGAGLAATAVAVLPPLRLHLGARSRTSSSPGELLRRPTVALALAATAAVMTAQFALVPNIAAYWQFNLGYPRERLGLLFIAGGVVSFAVMRIAGRLADRAGAAVTMAGGTALYVGVVLAAFVFPGRAPQALALFVAFMAASSFRMVPMQALTSRVPAPEERARFMSAQSVVQHLGSATGALLASSMLQQLPGGRLAGMDRVAWLALALAAIVPGLLWLLELRVRGRDAGAEELSADRRHAPVTAPSSQAAR